MILEGFSDTYYLLFIFVPNFLNLTILASRNCLRSLFSKFSRLNHNKGSKSVPLLMTNRLSYTPFILSPHVYIASRTTFPKISDIHLLPFIFYTTFKLLTIWLSQTLQICKRSYFMLKIVAKTSRISLYSTYLQSRRKVMSLEGFSVINYLLFFFCPTF